MKTGASLPSQASIHVIILQAIFTVCEQIVYADHWSCFWVIVVLSACLYSIAAALIAMVAAFFLWLSSMVRQQHTLPRYVGSLDILLGRSYKASAVTSDMPANNNVSIATFGDDVVVAYRKAETHFASGSAEIVVATSKNYEEWNTIWTYTTGKDDLREVFLWQLNGNLYLHFGCLAPHKKGFAPRGMCWTRTSDLKQWLEPTPFGRDTEITWDVKIREEESGPVAYKVGYVGNHYAADALLTVIFEKSSDGEIWTPVGKELGVYKGGVSEVSFAFTTSGDLVAIGRNEDGDHTGFGSQLFYAHKDHLGVWISMAFSHPQRFDSPRMMLMEGELVLFARYAREPYDVASAWFSMNVRRVINLIMYSSRPKSAAVYRVKLPSQDGVWASDPIEVIRSFDESYGDTGFFSAAKLNNSDEWVVANYSSSCHSHCPWFYGQLCATDIYVYRCWPKRR